MSQQELLALVVRQLERIGVDYMLTGSLVSSLQGEPRATHDTDIVIALKLEDERAMHALKAAFPEPAFYLDDEAMRAATRSRQMFNLIDTHSGDKVDFWLLTADAFDESRFQRRYAEEFDGIRLFVSRPEDTILMKLRWAELSGGSEKQFTDALRVYEVQFGGLDQAYIDDWAKRLGVEALLARLREQAQPLE
jgi:hypothetical protein